MKVMVIGGGAREHALVQLASRSTEVSEVICPTDNAGILREPKVRAFSPKGFSDEALVQRALRERISLAVVGLEKPLARGIVDRFRERGVPIFGPTRAAARIESSKWFAKCVMARAGVPHALASRYMPGVFDAALCDALTALRTRPAVVKADGLAGGKGVWICRTRSEAETALRTIIVERYYGGVALIEEFLEGDSRLPRPEVSIHALVDTRGNFITFPAVQDYKPLLDGDEGPNTGGMGSFTPVPWVAAKMEHEVRERVFAPVIREMRRLGCPFSGVLYAGLMRTSTGFKVLEFNVRFGDPELLPLSLLLDTDLMPILKRIAEGGSIAGLRLAWNQGVALTVTLSQEGYPSEVGERKVPERLLASPEDVVLFRAGTCITSGTEVAIGGRALGAAAMGADFAEARRRVYGYLGERLPGFHFRRDIASGY